MKGAKRIQEDNYPTPPALARVGWQVAQRYLAGRVNCAVSVCEPGCGDAQPFLREALRDRRTVNAWGCDVREVAAEGGAGDIVRVDWLGDAVGGGPWDVIITNPPYTVAEAFVRRAFQRLSASGIVVMLLRISFLAPACRREFWLEHPLSEVVVIRQRPSFTGDGRTDGMEYGFFVWARGVIQAPTLSWCEWEKPTRRRSVRKIPEIDLL